MQRLCFITGIAMLAIGELTAHGQSLTATADSSVQTAAFTRSAAPIGAQTVHFNRRPAEVGDEIEQTISMEMRLATSLRQGNELLERSRTTVRTSQRRNVSTTEVNDGRAMAVLVRYNEATRRFSRVDADATDDTTTSTPSNQPISGRAYHCRREPGEAGKLVITDEAGHIPPMDEYEIVAEHMEMVGRPNPLVQFLAGKTITIGQLIELPHEVATAVFNLGDRFGEVTQFNLTLEKIELQDGVECAVFLARVEAASNNSSQMRLQVEGPLVVQVGTCRAVRINLSGPIGMSETRGSYSTAYQMLGTGQLKVGITSLYRDSRR